MIGSLPKESGERFTILLISVVKELTIGFQCDILALNV